MCAQGPDYSVDEIIAKGARVCQGLSYGGNQHGAACERLPLCADALYGGWARHLWLRAEQRQTRPIVRKSDASRQRRKGWTCSSWTVAGNRMPVICIADRAPAPSQSANRRCQAFTIWRGLRSLHGISVCSSRP